MSLSICVLAFALLCPTPFIDLAVCAVQDKQDVLAMCALQLALQLRQEETKSRESSAKIEKKLRAIDTLLSEIT